MGPNIVWSSSVHNLPMWAIAGCGMNALYLRVMVFNQ
jgi:hypothetical protein